MKIQIVLIVLLAEIFITTVKGQSNLNTCDRITRHGYPCEEHTVTTSDGYILALYRIPNGHAGNRLASGEIKPVVFLMHCLFCSSDIFVLVGPNDGLPFMLADAGFDVWIGNSRGNVYSQRHTSLSPFSKEFWAFSLDEIAQIDLPTEIEYVLGVTGQPRLNYIGYSQGTTTLAILLSSKPNFAKKLKAVHLLAPAIYLCHVRSPPVLWLARYFGTPSSVTSFFATLPSQRAYGLIRALSSGLCQNPQVTELCVRILNTFTGFDSPYMNRTLIPELLITTPADGSNQQSHHFFQFITTCEFKAFDFGTEGNMAKYGSKKPPPYDVRNIRTEEPIEFYFSDNDFLAPPEDVEHLHSLMGDRDHWNRVRYSKYNHFDFTIASNVKSCINDCVVDRLQRYEGRPYAGTLCTCFKKKPFRK
ncbi:lipase 3 [Musca domestica]|uniref:Lipase n=1 Tax=Musca domestica TaxID=7370 RepID=A0A9J7DLQ3_MUSDO|nr:lipase 3 [Musca domestica]